MVGEVNYLAVLVSAVVTMAIGALWYGPLFGKAWMQAHGYTPERLQEMQKGMGKAYAISFVCYLVLAFVLALLLRLAGMEGLHGGIHVALLCWLGFAATIGLTAHLFSDRKPAAYLLDLGYQLVYFVATGAILGAWS